MANKFTGKRWVSGNKFLTKSGKTIKVNRTLMERSKARQEAKALRKAERMRGLPKSRLKRVLFRLHPKRVVRYWFSRDGAIMALKLTGVAIVVLFFSLMAVFAYFRKDLPNLKDISGDSIGGSIRYYDRERKTLLWEDYDAVKRNPVEREQIAQVMRDATIAAEDRDFYNHNGFNVKGIVRATLNNARGGSTQGGSTITQQVVKLNNPDFINQRTISRKIKELILSVELERSYSKEEILNGYLNSAPYGGLEYGVQVASKTYFQKDAKDLTLEEAAFLASIPKSIRYLSPYSGDFEKESLQGRIGYVLDGMADMGRITREQAEAAKKVDSLIFTAEKSLKDGGDKVPAELKTEVEDKIKALKDTLTAGSKEEIEAKTSELSESLQKVGQQMNASTNSAQGQTDEQPKNGETVEEPTAEADNVNESSENKKDEPVEGEVVN
jgi:membrane peptidoglycan carboxypeptidase